MGPKLKRIRLTYINRGGKSISIIGGFISTDYAINFAKWLGANTATATEI